jgi:hypothetical protein
MKVIPFRWAGTCTSCKAEIRGGLRAAWDPTYRTVRCLACLATPEGDRRRPAQYHSVNRHSLR